MSVGERIRNLREKQRMSQKELSELTGVAQSTISAIECGQQNPSVETLNALARGLGSSSSRLVEESVAYDPWPYPEELDRLLRQMDDRELQRVTDFAAGVISARRN